MPRMIDADKLMAWFDNYYDFEEFSVGYISGIINEQPTVDAVEVVRCRDCKWFEQNGSKEHGNCSKHLALAYLTDYCSWGERKE